MRSVRSARSLRRRGTASVEVVMMLPFFIVVFFGIYWMHAHYAGRQQAMLRARSCAWVFAAGACEDKATLDACLKDDGGRSAEKGEKAQGSASGSWPKPDPEQTSGTTKEEGAGELEDQQGPPAKVDGELGTSKTNAVFSKLEGIPLLGSAIKWLFGKPVTVNAREPISAVTPSFTEPERKEISIGGSYHTLCNSKPQSWKDLAHDIFCNFVGKFPGC
jgi:hypothetical protein